MVMEVDDEGGDNVLKSEEFLFLIYIKNESTGSVYELNTVIEIGKDVGVELISPRPIYHDRTFGPAPYAFYTCLNISLGSIQI